MTFELLAQRLARHSLFLKEAFLSLHLPFHIFQIIGGYQGAPTEIIPADHLLEHHQVFINDMGRWDHVWLPTLSGTFIEENSLVLEQTPVLPRTHIASQA
eukprot:CAMPEP_0170457978 /NCGR_PEP_ID=MMETSP0123-20130129/5085_1 /TAXON_ID=182087 /ORGANISM="Favella ehrenbergii, Strain Fehren 1" /LENGTH=99 /DNA_ID=CAMNT_0010721941 /DNA_START=1306 /DNA_END=1601 /DNA_ORIENTATION=-